MDLAQRLIVNSNLTLHDKISGQSFDFKYKRFEEEEFLIHAYHMDEFVGVCQIKEGEANLPFKRKFIFSEEKKAALCVSEKIRHKYKGLGTTLLSLAMGVCKNDRYGKFKVVANTRSYQFYLKHGFNIRYTEDENDSLNTNNPIRWYLEYDLNRSLPKKEIIAIQ